MWPTSCRRRVPHEWYPAGTRAVTSRPWPVSGSGAVDGVGVAATAT